MNWRKIGHICAIFYLFLYLAAMVMPRKLPYEQFSPRHSNFIKRAFHQILYYGGPLEPVANFFVLIPIFTIFLKYFGKSNAKNILLACITLSAIAESLQLLIPGRVSSIKDFVLNSLGAILAYFGFNYFKKSSKFVK